MPHHVNSRVRHLRRSSPITRAVASVTVLGLALVLAGCGSSTAGDSDGDNHVDVRTDVFFSGATLPLIVAKQKGYFKDKGLDVTIKPGKGSSTTLQTVANGSDDIGYADAGVLIQLAAKDTSVKMIAGMVQESPLEVVTLAKSGISSPKAIPGKTGGYVDGSAGEQLWPAFAKASGIDPDSVKFVHVDIPTRDSLLLSGKTKFSFGLYNVTEPLLSSKCDCKVRGFRYSEHGIDMLSSGLVTSPNYAKEHPDNLRKFLAAVSKSVKWSKKHPDQAVKAFMAEADKTKLTSKVVKQQWLKSAELLHSKRTKGQPFGCMSPKDWSSSVKLMGKYTEADTSDVDSDALWTNEFLKGCAS